MSWDGYIDNMIAQSKDSSGIAHICKGGIYGKDGSLWGKSEGVEVKTEEVKCLIPALTEGDTSHVAANGIVLEGKKYQFLRVDEDAKAMYGKKKGEGGISIMASKTAVIIGMYDEGKQAGNANKGVQVIGEYLESLNM
ncbi:profilin-like [Glandiceps talaboti]